MMAEGTSPGRLIVNQATMARGRINLQLDQLLHDFRQPRAASKVAFKVAEGTHSSSVAGETWD